jgi:cytochrome c-type biogenesis protein
VPFIISSLIIEKFLLFSKKSKSYLSKIRKFSGTTLLITGILIVIQKLQIVGFYLIQIFPFLQKLG